MTIQSKSKAQALTAPTLEQLIAQNTLEGYLAAFLIAGKVEGLSPATVASYRNLVGHFVKYATNTFNITDPRQLSPTHVRVYLLERQEKCKPAAVHAYYRHVRAFINWLVRENVLDHSPMATIKPPRVPRVLIKIFTKEQIKELLILCPDHIFLGLRNRAVILLFLETGIRLSEMANIQIDDINFDEGVIKIMGKGARERIVAIQEKTQTILLRYLLSRTDDYPCLWVTEERIPLSSRGIQKMIQDLGKLAGIQGVRCSPHTLRHTAATMMFEAGAREFEVQAILGHSTLAMTRRYVASINSEKAADAHKRFSPVEHLKF